MKKKSLSLILAGSLIFSGLSVFAEEKAEEKKLPPISITNAGNTPGNIFFDDAPVVIEAQFSNNEDRAIKFNTEYSVLNGDGETILSGDFGEISLAKGESAQKELKVEELKRDVYKLHIRAFNEETETVADLAFSSMVKSKVESDDSVLGFQTHLCRRLEHSDRTAQIIKNAGINWIRDEFYWSTVEKEKGKFNFYADRYLENIKKQDINLLLELNFGNPHYGNVPHDEIGYKGYANYCKVMAEHVKGQTDTFEIWNEWNGSFGGGYGTSEYANMLKAAYPAIKEVQPDSRVVMGATISTDLGWLEAVMKEAGPENFDIVSIHPYCFPSSPESGGVRSNIMSVHALLKKYGEDKPVWSTEIGWPTTADCIDESTAGAYIARLYALAKSLPEGDKIFIYDFECDGIDPKNREHNFGLVKSEYDVVPWAAKRGFLAVGTAANQLGDAVIKKTTPDSDMIQIYEFEKGENEILSVWSLDQRANVGLKVDVPEVTVTDWLGNSEVIKTTDGIVNVNISKYPVYIEGNFNGYEKAETGFELDEGEISVAQGDELTLTIKRTGNLAALSGGYRLEVPKGFTLKGDSNFSADGKDTQLTFTIDEKTETGKYSLNITAVSGENSYGKLHCGVDLVKATDVTIRPVLLDPGRWQQWAIDVTVTNHSRKEKITGGLEVTAPEELAGRKLSFDDVGYNESATLRIEMDTPPQNKLTQLGVAMTLSDGTKQEYKRATSCLAAVKRQSEIKLDGVLDEGEWDYGMKFDIDDESSISGYRKGSAEKYNGAEDLSAYGYLLWDDTYFYMAVSVVDDIHMQNSDGGGIWAGDGLQYTVDPYRMNGAGSNGWNEMGSAITNNGEIKQWRWQAIPSIAGGAMENVKSCIVRDEETNRVVYEIAIPWRDLLEVGASLKTGDLFGFTVIVNEDDGPGRDGWLGYMSGIGYKKDANQFGDVLLLDLAGDSVKTLSDADYAWADEAANVLYKKGIISKDYQGGSQVTKAEFTSMMIKATGLDKEEFSENFEGLSRDNPYYNELGIAKKRGIVWGDGEIFDPQKILSRQEMMTMMVNILSTLGQKKSDADSLVLDQFKDANELADYAIKSAAYLAAEGIIIGDDGYLYPTAQVKKAEAVSVIHQFIK